MVSYICVVLYNLFYIALMHIISLNPHDCPFLSHVMDEEIGSRTHPRSPGPGITEGQLLGEAEGCPRYCVLCQVWEHCSFCHMVAKAGPSPRFTGWQNISVGFQSCHWLRSPLWKDMTKYLSWFPSQLSIFLTLFLHVLNPLKRTSCQTVNF